MPIFTATISTQNQAGSAGIIAYPSIQQIRQFIILRDDFTREVLNPASTLALYTTTNGQGTGTSSILSGLQNQIQTTAVSGDNTDCRASAVGFVRSNSVDNNRSQLTFDFIWLDNETTARKIFIGIGGVSFGLGMTALPTTTRHLGLYLDTAVSNNYKLSSADGTTQTTTDTGIAVQSTTNNRLQILWNGDDSATINYFTTTTAGTTILPQTLVKSQTVSSFSAGSIAAYNARCFIITSAASAKNIFWRGWQVQAT